MTVHVRIYHFIDTLFPTSHLRHCFLSLYIGDMDQAAQGNKRSAQMPYLLLGLLKQTTEMIQKVNPYVQSFVSLREWDAPVDATHYYEMVIHSDS